MTVKEEKVDAARRCFLRQATTVVGGMGLAASAIPFISYWLPSLDTEAAAGPVTVDLSQIKPAEQVTVACQS